MLTDRGQDGYEVEVRKLPKVITMTFTESKTKTWQPKLHLDGMNMNPPTLLPGDTCELVVGSADEKKPHRVFIHYLAENEKFPS